MISLRPDCLVFKMSTGESIPCSAEKVTLELMGDAVELVDQDLIRNAAESVLHYFKSELKRTSVSVAEFAVALENVLRGLGVEVLPSDSDAPVTQDANLVAETDLTELASRTLRGFELSFYTSLREEFSRQLSKQPRLVRFRGLRGCVKHLAGAKRWSTRCQNLSDQIVDYLRSCLRAQKKKSCCGLVVR